MTHDDKGERRGSVEGRHQKLERKNSGNDRQSHYDKAKRSSLERYDHYSTWAVTAFSRGECNGLNRGYLTSGDF